MARLIKLAGFVACLIAVLVMSGGHWALLQSIAWGRMIAGFSQQDSLGTAISKTLSGKHPCPLCLKIRSGVQQEKQREKEMPWEQTQKMPEPIWELRCLTLPAPPTVARHDQAFVPFLHSDFIDSPPAPPPRFLVAL
jgi:hypothetical protein